MARIPPPVIDIGRCPSVVSIRAPNCPRGSTIRCIGRRLRESSPTTLEKNEHPDKIPESNRTVVPELAALRSLRGASRPPRPFPWIRTVSVGPATLSISTPSPSRQRNVLKQSAPRGKFSAVVMPSAIAPISAARWAMALSPGTRVSPRSRFAGRISTVFMIFGFDPVETESQNSTLVRWRPPPGTHALMGSAPRRRSATPAFSRFGIGGGKLRFAES